MIGSKPQRISLALLAPALLCLGIFALAIGSTALSSLRPERLTDSGISLNQYARFLGDPHYVLYVWRSVKVSLYGTVLTLCAGYPVAYLMARAGSPMRVFLTVLLVVQFFTSYIVRAYALMLVLGNNGLINRILLSTGVIRSPLPLLYNEFGVTIGLVMVSLPFMVFPVYSVLKGISGRLEEAAESLGAGGWQVFSYVTLPLSLPGVAAGVIIVFLFQMTSFIVPGLLGGGYYDMVANFIYDQALGVMNVPFASAVSMVMLGFTLLLVVGLNKLFLRGLKDVTG